MFLKENGWNIRTYKCQNWQKLKLIYHEFWIADFGKWQKCCRSLWRSPQLFHKYENSQFSYEKDNNFDIFWYDNCRWSTENRITSLLHTMLSKDWDKVSSLFFGSFSCCIPCLIRINSQKRASAQFQCGCLSITWLVTKCWYFGIYHYILVTINNCILSNCR